MVSSLKDGDEEGGEVVFLCGGELGGAREPEEVREKAVDDMKVCAADFREDGGVAGEERKNGAAEVAVEEST